MARPLPADEASPAPASSINERLQVLLPKLVLSPSVVLVLIFVYGFIQGKITKNFSESMSYCESDVDFSDKAISIHRHAWG